MNSLYLLLVISAAYVLYTVIKTKSARKKIESYLQTGARVIDVRSPQEYESGHFSTAINIPHDRIEQRLGELGQDKQKPIILYCYAGSRSAVAEQILRKNGFMGVVNARNLENLSRFDKKSTP
jgi:phage shock protein E